MLYVSSLPQVRDFAQQEAFRIDSSSLIPFIEKELLHIDLLNSFVPQMQNTSLVFQGGTALRLCYGAPRYSEDLDFSVGSDFYQAEKLKMARSLGYELDDRKIGYYSSYFPIT